MYPVASPTYTTTTTYPTGAFTHQHTQACQNTCQMNINKNNKQAMEEERVYAPVESGVVGGLTVWRQIHCDFVRAMDDIIEQPPLQQPEPQPLEHHIIHQEEAAGAGAGVDGKLGGNNAINSLLSSSLGLRSSSSRSGSRRSLPAEMMKMIKKLKMSTSSKNCSICVTHFVKDEIIRQLPCGHIFHEGCLKPWLRDNSVCPNCRFDLFEHFSQQQ